MIAALAVYLLVAAAIPLAKSDNFLDGIEEYELTRFDNTTLNCLAQKNYTRFILIIWRNNIDQDIISRYNALRSIGIPTIELEWWPSPDAPGNYPASVPANQIIQTIFDNQMHVNRVWLAIGNAFGPSGIDENREYLLDAINTIQSAGFGAGISSDASDFDQIFGDDWRDPTVMNLPVIYYGNPDRNFDDWSKDAFGGWTTPFAKETSTRTTCVDDAYSLIFQAS